MPYTVGLTGGIGCGKSTVAKIFAELGATVIDTDAISHALTQAGAGGFSEIVQQFGTEFVTSQGTLDRAKLRTLIFSDDPAKAKLEAILHPLILAQARTELNACNTPYALLVVPLLFETGNFLPLLQRSLVVDCDEISQVRRTMTRSNLSESEVRAILVHQMPGQDRLQRADDIIRNDEGLEALQAAVSALHARYRKLSVTYG